MNIDVKIPDIGDYKDVEVIEIPIKIGDSIEKEDTILILETDKATMEIPSPESGTINEIKVKVGDKVSEGSLVAILISKAAPKPEPAPKPKSQSSNSQEAKVPDIGDYKGVEVIEINVQVGDSIDKEETILTLETDKATMEIPSPFAGTIEKIMVKVGDKISQDDVIASMQTAEVALPKKQEPKVEVPKPIEAKPSPTPTETINSSAEAYASPMVRKYARSLGVTLTEVQGTGRKSRITKEDVTLFVKNKMQSKSTGVTSSVPMPDVNFAEFGEIEYQDLPRIKKLSGTFLHRNWTTIPHVTQFDEADITELEAFRKSQKELAAKQGIKLTPLVFLMKAVVAGLQQFPTFNSSLDNSQSKLILKKYFHIGVAVDTPNGLVVPVVRDVNKKGLFQLAQELADISKKARDGKLSAKDMQGSCFTISSLGGIGGTAFTPIVNMPDVAILGVSRSKIQPVYIDGEFVPRLMLPLSLSYDHRVIDGADGARFASFLARQLSDIRRLLL